MNTIRILFNGNITFNVTVRSWYPMLLLSALLCTSSVAFAQKTKEFNKYYEDAVSEYKNGQYSLASMKLDKVTVSNPNNTHTEEAYYFKALCQFRMGELNRAEQEFTKIRNNYPDWKRLEEVHYMLGNIAFEKEDYIGGMAILKNCTSEALTTDIFNMKRYYLTQIKNFNMMRALYARYGDDDALCLVYLERLTERKFLWPYERDQLAYLKQTFVEDPEIVKKIETLERKGKKDFYHVAAFFPFELDKLMEFKMKTGNQFVIDLYNGLDMAIEELDSVHGDSVHIALHVYDSQNDSAAIDSVMRLEEFSNIDLIFGPVFKTEHAVVEKYCNANKVCKINPLSKISVPEDSAFGLYFETSMENLAVRTAEFCFDSIAQENVFIAGYKNPKDTAFVEAFKARFDSLGGKNVKVRYFNKFDQILSMMGEMKLDTSNTDAIIVCNGNSKIVSNVCSYYTVTRSEIPMITTYDFVKSDQFLVRPFAYTDLYVMHTDYYIDSLQNDFFNRYVEKYMYPPSRHSFTGYEMGHFFGSQLMKHGRYFNNIISATDTLLPGKIRPYFNYYQSNNNTFVPVTRMIDYELVPVNLPEIKKPEGDSGQEPDYDKYDFDEGEENQDE